MAKKAQKQAKQEQKQQQKQLKIQQKEQARQDKWAAAAADGKIGKNELKSLFGKNYAWGKLYGKGSSRGEQATELARFALGNPNVSIGKGVSKITGMKIKNGDGGERYATYSPKDFNYYSKVTGSVNKTETPDFGKAGGLWLSNGKNGFTYNGAPGMKVEQQSQTSRDAGGGDYTFDHGYNTDFPDITFPEPSAPTPPGAPPNTAGGGGGEGDVASFATTWQAAKAGKRVKTGRNSLINRNAPTANFAPNSWGVGVNF